MSKQTYDGRYYSSDEIQQANRLLRLEMKLGSQFWFRSDWRKADAVFLRHTWETYFMRMIGDADMQTDNDIEQRIQAAAKTKGQAKAAYLCWNSIQTHGWERARNFYTKRSWYRHIKTMRDAGLGDADISAGQIVPLRRRVLEARLVTCWNQLKAA